MSSLNLSARTQTRPLLDQLSRVFRATILPAFDVALSLVTLTLAYFLRFDGRIPASYLSPLPKILLAWAVVRLLWLAVYRFYKQSWQYASIREIVVVLSALTAGTLCLYTANLLLPWDGVHVRVPRSIFAIEWFLAVFAIGGSRLLIRVWHDTNTHRYNMQRGRTSRLEKGQKRLLIIGAGDAGVMALKEIRQATHWQVVGFIDDSPNKQRKVVSGVPVLGKREDISSVVEAEAVDEILIAMPSVSRETLVEIVTIAQQTGCPIRTLPALHELIGGRVSVGQIREIRIEDLLGRDPVTVDTTAVAEYLSGKTVLISGAGGSIGSELCRQVARFSPKRLLLLGHGENSIFEIEMEAKTSFPELKLVPIIADVKDQGKLEMVFSKYRPEVVFHAAAHKHVPLMELHPDEAVKNNVIGTLNIASTAKQYGTKKFVLISTDKAVNPSSVMGMTKRLAEMLILSLNGGGTAFMAVRFGNVLGSRGSVVPTFKKQIAAGGPVTVTHPDMTRYFMTIPEAAQLVIQAGAIGQGHEIFVLDMGEPVKILELAENLIRLSGFEPNTDIPIRFTGVRPGEKLYEELFTNEEGASATRHSRIFVAKPRMIDGRELMKGIQELQDIVSNGDRGQLRQRLLEMVSGGADLVDEAAATSDN